MFRVYQIGPHRTLKIPFPASICFEESPETLVGVAVEVGKTAAEVEQLEEKLDAIEQKEEYRNWWEKYTEESINTLFTRLSELENRVDILETQEVIEEENNPGIHEETPPEEKPAEETIIKPAESETPAPAEKEKPKKKRKHKAWGLF